MFHQHLRADMYQKLYSSSKCSHNFYYHASPLTLYTSSVYRKDSEPPSEEGSEGRELGENPPEKGTPQLRSSHLMPSNHAVTVQALQQGNNDGARIYASNAIRKKSEALNLLRLSSRIDAVASRVETAVTMRQVTGNMTSVVRGMDKAMDSMNLERVRSTLIPSLFILA
jgi:hypothetical protein